MNNIGEILKRLREENNLTGKETVDKLKELGIDISAKTLYGYESGRNSTNADMFLALCKIYKCQNIMSAFSDSTDEVLFTNKEWNIIEQYRSLDDAGKNHINYELNREVRRVEKQQEQSKYIQKLLNSNNDFIDPYADIPDTLEELEKQQQPESLLPDAEHHAG
jgi:transcriptional regulator with XRE-family HTH domain